MGALLGRFGEASCPPPGGDVIGQRPIEVHLDGFRLLGAEIERDADTFHARAQRSSRARRSSADYPSVLGTQNTHDGGRLRQGHDNHRQRRRRARGAEPGRDAARRWARRSSGAGTHTVTIDGVAALHGTATRIIPDRLEAGTFAIAAAITDGDVEVRGINLEHLIVAHLQAARRPASTSRPATTSIRVRGVDRPERDRRAGAALPRLRDRPPGADGRAADAGQRRQLSSTSASSTTACSTSASCARWAPR